MTVFFSRKMPCGAFDRLVRTQIDADAAKFSLFDIIEGC